MRDGLERLGWTSAQLRRERKGHPAKDKLATRLSQENDHDMDWISRELHAGAWRSLATRANE
jgi:hypothetical protein